MKSTSQKSQAEEGSRPGSGNDLKSLATLELLKKLGSSPDGLSHSAAGIGVCPFRVMLWLGSS